MGALPSPSMISQRNYGPACSLRFLSFFENHPCISFLFLKWRNWVGDPQGPLLQSTHLTCIFHNAYSEQCWAVLGIGKPVYIKDCMTLASDLRAPQPPPPISQGESLDRLSIPGPGWDLGVGMPSRNPAEWIPHGDNSNERDGRAGGCGVPWKSMSLASE